LANQLCQTFRYFCFFILFELFRYNHVEKKWWKPIFEHINQITFANIYIIHKHLQPKNPRTRTNFHLKIIKYLIYKEKIEFPLKLEHYPDWVPAKKEQLEQEGNGQVGGQKDFRLRCRWIGCSKKTELCCPGCSKADSIVALCVPQCFKLYHEIKN